MNTSFSTGCQKLLTMLCVTSLAAVAAAAPPGQGERIVFLGDSITQAGANAGGYVTLVREKLAEKHKDRAIEVIGVVLGARNR